MKSNRRLTRAIRRTARERLRASQVLWKDYKRMRRARWHRMQVGRWVVMLYPIVILAVLGQRASDELLILLLSLYCTATIFWRSTRFAMTLYRSADLAFFMHAPVTDADFFDFQWPRFLGSSLLVWVSAASVFVLLALRHGVPYGVNLVAALAAATLQWLVVVTFCVILHLLPLRFMSVRVAIPLYGLGFAAIFFPVEWVERLRTVVALLPTAWVPWVFERGVLAHDTSMLARVLAVVVLVAILPLVYHRMRKAYPRFELAYPLLANRVNTTETVAESDKGTRRVEVRTESNGERARVVGPPSSAIQLPSLNWETSGWIERMVGRWLNARERQAAAFLCGGRLGQWSSAWKLGVKITAVGIVTMFLTMLLPEWVCFAAGGVAALCALPVFGGRWDGLQVAASSGTVGPAYAGLPLSYSEITRVLLKVNLVRYAVWSPIFLIYAVGLARVVDVPWFVGLRMGFEFLSILISGQLVCAMGHHSTGTNDTKRVTWHSFMGILTVLAIAIPYLLSIGFFLYAIEGARTPEIALAAAAFAGMFLFSWLIWIAYRLLYNRGRIDLMRLPG